MKDDIIHAADYKLSGTWTRCGKSRDEASYFDMDGKDDYPRFRPGWRITEADKLVTRADGITCPACIEAPRSPMLFKCFPWSRWGPFWKIKNDNCPTCSEYVYDVKAEIGGGTATIAQTQTDEAASLIVEALNALRDSQLGAKKESP